MIIDYLIEAEDGAGLKERLEELAGDDDAYVTFTDIPKVGVNPNTKWNTPLGVYAYPVWFIVEEWDNLKKHGIFALDRKYANILKHTRNGKYIYDIGYDYTKPQFTKDLKTLNEHLLKEYDFITPEKLEEAMATVKKGEGVYTDSPGSVMWSYIHELSIEVAETLKKSSPKDIATLQYKWWSKLLGYNMIGDNSNLGIIHPNEPSQAIFMSPESYKVVDRIEK